MSQHDPHRIFFQLTALPDDQAAPDFKARCNRQLHYQGRLLAAGVSRFQFIAADMFCPEQRWAEIPYGDPLEPVMRLFMEGLSVGEYESVTDPRPKGVTQERITYTPRTAHDYR